jgi:formylglycine-generating enzyme required for sulfatase activity
MECEAALSRSVAWLWLPTEAQWEYACRAGTATPWWTGERESTLHGAANVDFDTNLNRPNALQRIGLLRGNPFGFHDMHGNAWEWCRDAVGGRATIRQPGNGFLDEPDAIARAARGGYSGTSARDARSSLTLPFRPGNRSEMLGLRPARGITR